MEWTIPSGYGFLAEPIPTAFAPEARTLAEEAAISLRLGLHDLIELFGFEYVPMQLIIGAARDRDRLPEGDLKIPDQASTFLPYYLVINESPIMVFPSALHKPIRPTSPMMRQLLLWREAAHHLLRTNAPLDFESLPFWLEAMLMWVGAVCVSRAQNLSLVEAIIGMHSGHEAPHITEFFSESGWSLNDLMGLHKQLLTISIELYSQSGPEILSRLLIAIGNTSLPYHPRSVLALAVGSQNLDWMDWHDSLKEENDDR